MLKMIRNNKNNNVFKYVQNNPTVSHTFKRTSQSLYIFRWLNFIVPVPDAGYCIPYYNGPYGFSYINPFLTTFNIITVHVKLQKTPTNCIRRKKNYFIYTWCKCVGPKDSVPRLRLLHSPNQIPLLGTKMILLVEIQI